MLRTLYEDLLHLRLGADAPLSMDINSTSSIHIA